jgi:hypothetical protein
MVLVQKYFQFAQNIIVLVVVTTMSASIPSKAKSSGARPHFHYKRKAQAVIEAERVGDELPTAYWKPSTATSRPPSDDLPCIWSP